MIKLGIKIEQPPGRVITARKMVIFSASMYPGHLDSMVQFLVTSMRK